MVSAVKGLLGQGGGSSASGVSVIRDRNIVSPGFNFSSKEGNSNLSRTGSAAQSAFDSRFNRSLGDLDFLRGRVAPLASDIRQSTLESLANNRTRAIGNLRENLGRRRVLGSSFGNDALSRAESEFAQQERRALAEVGVQELGLTSQVLSQEAQFVNAALTRELQELQIGAGISANVTNAFTQQMGIRANAIANDERLQLASAELGRQTANDVTQGILSSVICTELSRRKMIPDHVRRVGAVYHSKMGDDRIMRGYHTWAIPVVRYMRKREWFAQAVAKIAIPIALGRCRYMKDRMKDRKPNKWFRFCNAVVEWPSWIVGGFVKENVDYTVLYGEAA